MLVKHEVLKFVSVFLGRKQREPSLFTFFCDCRYISFEVLRDDNIWVLLSRVSNDSEFHQKVSGVLIESNGANNNLQGQ